MNGVKRYDPVNSDGTCGMCVEDADYGAYVEYADYAALEAELVELLRSKFPRIDPCQPVPLDEKAHCCEYTIYVKRERLHRIIDAKLASLKGVEE